MYTFIYIITILINFLHKRAQNKSTPQKEQKVAETILNSENRAIDHLKCA